MMKETSKKARTKKSVLKEDTAKNIKVEPIEEIDPKSIDGVKIPTAATPEKPAFKKKKVKRTPDLSKAKRFEVNEKIGLTEEQVQERFAQGYYNKATTRTTKSYLRIIAGNIFTFFNLLAVICAAMFIISGSYTNLTFLVVYVANLIISLIAEIRSKIAVEKISLLTAPIVTAIRDGVEITMPVEDIVLDDVLVFSTGKQISADSIVLSGSVEVNESLLTGESVPVKKKAGDTLFAGSFVVAGKCRAKAEKLGDLNYSSSLVKKAQQLNKPKSELLKSINTVIKVVGFLIIPLAAIRYYLTYLHQLNNPITDPITGEVLSAVNHFANMSSTASVAILMVPAGMYLSISIALAWGVINLARKRTLVQNIYSIEMLSRVNVLCLDKTGTITDGTMKVKSVINIDKTIGDKVNSVMGNMLTALNDNNLTSLALASHFGYSKDMPVSGIIPFSSARKYSAVSFHINEVEGSKTYIFGAPEFVLKTNNTIVSRLVKEYSEQGHRVLLLAEVKGQIEKEALPKGTINPVAVMVIEDHIRETAADTIKWFNANDVEVKVISGDNPVTVSEICKRVGVVGAEKYISLEGLTKQQVVDCAGKYAVFGRVSPEQKAILVKALKNKGKKVAMTGDGVNDILALKEADCSIAMASGADAARNVSHVVLLDSDFSAMPSIVAEGRRVINNISRGSSLFLMKTFFAFMITIITLFPYFAMPNLFKTTHFMMLELFIIGLPSLVISLQPNNQPITGGFLANLISKAIPGAVLYTLGVMACFFLDKLGIVAAVDTIINIGGQETVVTQFTSMAILTVTFTGLFIVYRICKPFDILRSFMFIIISIAIGICVLVTPILHFMGIAQPELINTLIIIILVQLSYNAYSAVVWGSDKLMAFLKRIQKKE